MNRFIALEGAGKGGWLRYAASLALIAFCYLVVGSLGLVAVVWLNGGLPFPWDGRPAAQGPLSGMDPFLTFYLPVSFSFISLAAALAVSARFIHSRPALTLITPRKQLDWGRISLGFWIFLAFNAVSNAASFILDPSAFSITLNPARLLLFAPIYAALTVVQTTSEEMLFRGYLLQGIGSAFRSPLAGAIFSSLVFMAVHAGNPETANGLWLALAYYFSVGLWLCLVTLRSGSSEIAIGAHAANNLFILFLNYETSALEMVPSLFKMNDVGGADLWLSLALFIVMGAAAYTLLFRGSRREAPGPKS